MRALVVCLVLLVFGCRKGEPPAVTGEVVLEEMVAIPAGARMSVAVEDVPRADAPARVLASVDVPLDGKDQPIPFTVPLPGSKEARSLPRCGLRVRITGADGALLFTNDIPVEVISNGRMRVDVPVKRVRQD